MVAVQRRQFLTQREFQELKSSRVTGVPCPTLSWLSEAAARVVEGTPSIQKMAVEVSPKVFTRSEVESHDASDSIVSDVPSSASAAAGLTTHVQASPQLVMPEIERLRQENFTLRFQNAALRQSPTKADGSSPSSCTSAASQQLRLGAPLQYFVSPGCSNSVGGFELGFSAAEAMDFKLNTRLHFGDLQAELC